MKISLNDSEYQVSETAHLNEALQLLELSDQAGVAVAVNGKVIPKQKWKEQRLKNGDNVMVIRAAQGG